MAAKQADKTSADLKAVYQALDRVQAIIEFDMEGITLSANDIFLDVMGYELDEIVGQHHRMFCEAEYADSSEYKAFWNQLSKGDLHCAEFKRLAKDGREVWLQASYNPVLDGKGKPVKVVKFATDITADKRSNAEMEGMLAAINRSQAVIQFGLDGSVLDANENFLRIFDYDLADIVGRPHRMFCDPSYAESDEYRNFWHRLGNGDYESGEFKRLNREGVEVWLQASYNPIFDEEGRLLKVVKFASDITEEVQNRSLAMLEMSTPVAKIWEGVLFAPIVGIVDSRRSRDIMNKALSSIVDHRAHTLMLDIGGVGVVDTAVANHLIKIAKAAVLMGCKTIISGISPAIAQTITELGIDMGNVRTTSTIESALREAITANAQS